MTNPSGLSPVHTPPSPSLCVLRQMSEDPSSGTTTGKDGDCMGSTSQGFSLHHFTLISPTLCYVPFLYLTFQASGFHCSFCDYETFTEVSPRHTPHVTLPSVAMLPGARCGLRLELETYYGMSPTNPSVSYSLFFMVLTEDIFIQNLKYQDNNVRTHLKHNSTLNIIDSINP